MEGAEHVLAVTILAAHTLVMFGRFNRRVAKIVDHRIRVLVDHGRVRQDQLKICGLTENDLSSQLRQLGAHRLDELRYVLYETKGELSLVREDEPGGDLVTGGLRDAAGYPGVDEPSL